MNLWFIWILWKHFFHFAIKMGQPVPLYGRHCAGNDRNASALQPAATVDQNRSIGKPTGKGRQGRESIEENERHSRRPAPCACLNSHSLTAFPSAFDFLLAAGSWCGYSIQNCCIYKTVKNKMKIAYNVHFFVFCLTAPALCARVF